MVAYIFKVYGMPFRYVNVYTQTKYDRHTVSQLVDGCHSMTCNYHAYFGELSISFIAANLAMIS